MPALPDFEQSRVRFHLGYSAIDGIPDGDEARLIYMMSAIRNNTTLSYIVQTLDALDDAYSALLSDDIYDSRQLIAGDINRSTTTDTPNDYRVWLERYLNKTDQLARILNVANYQRPEQARYRFMRLGSVSVFPSVGNPTGIADTSVSDKLILPQNYV